MKMQEQARMGYDRSITMFSPDGRLLQVEYAKKTVRQGSTAIGFTCKDGVVLVADKRSSGRLIVAKAIEKTFKIDNHLAATASGIISDARVLIERAQMKAQQHAVTYDTPVDIITIVKDISDLCQYTTQSAGLRPFGVSLIIAGIDDGQPKLYVTDPTGIYFQYYATVIGEGEIDIEKVLQKKYKASMTMAEALELAVSTLKEYLGEDFNADRLDAIYIPINNPQVNDFSREDIRKAAQ